MPYKPPTKGTLFDVPVKRIASKSPFLRKLEREQAAKRLIDQCCAEADEDRRQRVRDAAERGLRASRRNVAVADRSNVRPIRGDK